MKCEFNLRCQFEYPDNSTVFLGVSVRGLTFLGDVSNGPEGLSKAECLPRVGPRNPGRTKQATSFLPARAGTCLLPLDWNSHRSLPRFSGLCPWPAQQHQLFLVSSLQVANTVDILTFIACGSILHPSSFCPRVFPRPRDSPDQLDW